VRFLDDILKCQMLNSLFIQLPYQVQVLFLAIHHELSRVKRIIRNEKIKYSKELLEELRTVVSKGETKRKNLQSQKVVLVDFFPVELWTVINSIASRHVCQLFESQLRVVDFYRPSGTYRELYKALGFSVFSRIKVNLREFLVLLNFYRDFFSNCKTKKDFLEFQIDEIAIGIDIYESYLRSGNPTIVISDFRYRKWAFLAFMQLLYLNRLHREKNVTAIFSSHENYVGPGLLAKFGFRHQIPVFFVNAFEINIPEQLFENHQRYASYPLYFSHLKDAEKVQGRSIAREMLNRRISGEVGVMMNYQEESAFSGEIHERQLKESSARKLLIATHDFFDNPHAFEVLPFVDFLDWLTYLSNQATHLSEYEWYLKIHRDFSQKEKEIVDGFLFQNTHIKQVNPDVSFHQLKKEGLDAVLTCFGSVGHELPLLGIGVISFSFNPHSAYNFNFPVADTSRLREVIEDALSFKLTTQICEEICEFFYVHKFINHPKDFNVSDFDKLEKLQFDGVKTLKCITEDFKDIQSRVTDNLRDAIVSRRKYSIERNLPSSKQIINMGTQLDTLRALITNERGSSGK